MHAPDALAELRTAPPGVDRDVFSDLVTSRGDDALSREGGPEHLTASCFVLSPDLSHVLLCLHRKGRFWRRHRADQRMCIPVPGRDGSGSRTPRIVDRILHRRQRTSTSDAGTRAATPPTSGVVDQAAG